MKYSQNNILPYDGEVYFYAGYLNLQTADKFMQEILATSQFREDKIKMFGKISPQPRKVAWHGDEGVRYIYSHIEMISPGWTAPLLAIRNQLAEDFGVCFNSVLVNLYRDGEDYMSYHTDNEPELGEDPLIASLSLGEVRDFCLKHNNTKEVIKLALGDGDLVFMKGKTQTFWKHSIPKRKKVHRPRLNLTFRLIKS